MSYTLFQLLEIFGVPLGIIIIYLIVMYCNRWCDRNLTISEGELAIAARQVVANANYAFTTFNVANAGGGETQHITLNLQASHVVIDINVTGRKTEEDVEKFMRFEEYKRCGGESNKKIDDDDDDDDKDCSICLEVFEEGEVLGVLACQHVFHSHCIMQWLQENFTCPNCRLGLDTTNASI